MAAARSLLPPWSVLGAEGFKLQPTIFEYAGRAIVLHPKFESPGMRDKVREFLERFYAPGERAFHKFCVENEADYFVLSLGMFANPKNRKSKEWLYSWRYIAAATGDVASKLDSPAYQVRSHRCALGRRVLICRRPFKSAAATILFSTLSAPSCQQIFDCPNFFTRIRQKIECNSSSRSASVSMENMEFSSG